MRIALGSDHAGRELRQDVAKHLAEAGHTLLDLGTETAASVDYPAYAERVGHSVTAGDAELGILVCGTGIGMSMAANRLPGIRAAMCTNEFMAKMSRAHNDANVLCLGQRVSGVGVAFGIVDAFVGGAFEGGRHGNRVALLAELEKRR
jgi:ribose 5-phosphate isomerase B